MVAASAEPRVRDVVPIIDVTLIEGRPPEQLRELISRLTEAAVSSIDAPRESVRVILHEVPPTHFATGDVTIAERTGGSS